MSNNPFLLETPGVINFSGGRTSAFMLYKTIEAHDGVLPEHCYVIFCNTGRFKENVNIDLKRIK